jgi:hypothetical protein
VLDARMSSHQVAEKFPLGFPDRRNHTQSGNDYSPSHLQPIE